MWSMLFVFQLAGVVAVEITGGPTIPFHPGRKVLNLTFAMPGIHSRYCRYSSAPISEVYLQI